MYLLLDGALPEQRKDRQNGQRVENRTCVEEGKAQPGVDGGQLWLHKEVAGGEWLLLETALSSNS